MSFTVGYDTDDGYRYYGVEKRGESKVLGGLCLPLPTGTTCRLVLHAGSSGLHKQPMTSSDGGLCADGREMDGVYTTGISGCQAIGIFTYDGANWTRFFFQHCMAGFYNLKKAKSYLTDPKQCWAFVAQIGRCGLEDTVGDIAKLGVPKRRIIGYNAGDASIIGFGVRLHGGPFGGNFGEVDG